MNDKKTDAMRTDIEKKFNYLTKQKDFNKVWEILNKIIKKNLKEDSDITLKNLKAQEIYPPTGKSTS